MTTDSVSKEKLRITFKKARQDEVEELDRRTKSASQPPENVKSIIQDGRQLLKKDHSDVSFVIQEKESLYTYRTKATRITEDIKTEQTTSDYLIKKEFAISILDEILLRVEETEILSRESSTYCLKHKSSQFSKPTITPSTNKGLRIRNDHRNTNLDKIRKRHLTSVIKELDLPINLSKSKVIAQSRPTFEKLIFDSLVTASSTIIKTPERSSQLLASPRSGDYIGPSSKDNIGPPEEDTTRRSPFELCWCFGFNSEVPVINLSTDTSSEVLFANSQYAVIYDFHEETMSFLQGHLNTVSCMAANQKRTVLVTADSDTGVEPTRVIVWNRQPCVLQVMDNVHPRGCQQVGLSPNGEFLVTVSAKETPVSIKVWEFNKDNRTPSASTIVKESLGTVKKLTTHPVSKNVFAVSFERSVLFSRIAWQTVFKETSEEGKVSEKIKDCEFLISASIPLKLGVLTDLTFLEDSETVALSSSSKGYVIVWEDNVNSKHKRTYKKYVRLHLDCITHIEIVDDKIAVATVSGNVSFYDLDLKILFFHKLHQEPLVSLSFNLNTQHNQATTCGAHQSCANTWRKEPRKLFDASLNSEPFSARHYIVSTENGRIAYVNASSGTPKYFPFPGKEMYTAIDMLPKSKFLCAGTASAKCILFDTNLRKVKVTKQIKVQPNLCQAISSLKYSPSGYNLACGMYTGDIWLLDPLLLVPVFDSPLSDCNCCITHIVFSPSSEFLVVSDVSFCVTAYYLGEKPTLIGQYVCHYKSIVAITVLAESSDKEVRVCSLSSDRSICVFVIDTEKKTFEFLLNQRVEPTATPMYSVIYPLPVHGTYLGISKELKFKLHDDPLITLSCPTITKRCRGTFQAPNFGSPINYMDIFESNHQPYLFFKTKNHLGIHLLPVDGNPFRALGFRASPTDITGCSIDHEGNYLFTISESFDGINMWKLNPKAVEDFYKSGGEGIEPFLKMLGKEKEQEIRDFFDLGQFLHQGERPNLVRTLKNSLPICEVANVLQALGCLLTKQETNELTNSIVYADPENPVYNIEYEDFIRLYINNRGTDDLKLEDLRQAFQDLQTSAADSSGRDEVFDAPTFMQKILAAGEELTAEELYADLSVLTGGKFDPPEVEHLIFQVPPTMPKEISFETLVKDILGFAIKDSAFNEN